MKRGVNVLLICLVSSMFMVVNGCDQYEEEEVAEVATDYSQSAHWLSLPNTSLDVDIFYLYPTMWYPDDGDGIICEIDNSSMLEGAAFAFSFQATPFSEIGNIYAPFYRQVERDYVLSLSDEDRERVTRGVPTLDVTAAFDYYIQHHNHGRPFILVGHSQGATVMSYLLSDYLGDHLDIYENMIAAYVLGHPVTAEYLATYPHLKFAEGADDVGVIISYNTQSADVGPGEHNVLGDMIGLVINPITWSRDEVTATRDQGLGSFMPDPESMIFSRTPQYADATVNTSWGVLICTTAIDSNLILSSPGIYHSYDIPFYYYNIQENAENRTNHFLNR